MSQLLEEIISGSAEVFTALYAEHAAAVFRLCGRRCGDWDLAEDLTSVAFLEAWKDRRRAFAVRGSLLPWLLGIAANVASTAQRSLRRHRAALVRFQGTAEAQGLEQDCANDAVRSADLDRIGQAVRAAMDRLPRAQREVAELCLMGELTADQAAAALRLPVSTVRSRLDYVRRHLRRLLQSEEIGRSSWLIGHYQDERHVTGVPERN